MDASPTGDRGGWAAPARSARATADPAVDAWLAALLGPPGRATVMANVPVTALELTATDWVRIASAGERGRAELAVRAALAAWLGNPGAARLDPTPELANLLELASSLAALLAVSRPLTDADLQAPHATAAATLDVGDLDHRAARARADIEALIAALESGTDEAAALLAAQALAPAAHLALEDGAAGASRLAAEFRKRLADADATASATTDTGDADQRWRRLDQQLCTLLGPGAVVLPRFVPANAADVAASADDPALLGDDRVALSSWLARMARVRAPLQRLSLALGEVEALSGVPFELRAAQLPHRPGARWNGLPSPSYVAGAVSLSVHGLGTIQPGAAVCGLMVDEWTEIVPAAQETTGVTFRYDAPNSVAPQAILIAAPPDRTKPWSVGGLNQVLIETLEWARLRAVPPAALGDIRQLLPATALAFNGAADVPSTNPNALMAVEP